ncbi:hypothetical protein Bca52824_016260 [Brassica carinata]|uniref:EVE domain-containing protein n=1 Tax=Brassica carinata TaxID=52824 RepID=A0A8X8B6D1_BRACI|nr:hypothetical protein Bca52824_016260 [Brassica carinata]
MTSLLATWKKAKETKISKDGESEAILATENRAKRDGESERRHQQMGRGQEAQKNLKSMTSGDLCFFYHSGTKSRCVVGVVELAREWYADDDDGEGAVNVKAPRLSVVPVEDDVWKKICEMGDGFCGDGKEDRESSDES